MRSPGRTRAPDARRGRSGIWRLTLPLTLAVALMPALPAAAVTPITLDPAQPPGSHSILVKPGQRPADLSQGVTAGSAIKKIVKWPSAGTAEVSLAGSAPAKAGALPVWVGPGVAGQADAAVKVEVLDRAKNPLALKDSVVFRVTPSAAKPGKVSVGVDYSGFSTAYGGDWAGRLRLVALPECALSTPEAASCQPILLNSKNDPKTMRVSSEIDLAAPAGMMMALTAGSSSSTGDYGATTLQASSTWTAGGSSGDFSWDYPIQVPKSLGGPAPMISLAYSSSAVDGRNSGTNNQPSWVGQGFEWSPGSIERSYVPCASDMESPGHNNTVKTGDLCWGTDNAVMSLNGHSGELVKDDTTGVWKLQSDDGSRIERLDDTAVPADNTVNGARNNEFWKVTTSDGWQYYFGLNRLKGYTGTAPASTVTNSVFTAPVAGNSTGDPCRATLFKDSFCTQAWRWNLDYVVDPSGNTMSYWYTKHTNKYAKNLVATDATVYDRGGKLDKIAYGTDNRSGTDTIYTSTKAPMQVLFETDDRCVTTSCGTHDFVNWPDTPYDQECTGSSCSGKYVPVFFSTVRLKKITTQVVKNGSHSDVDSWALTHQFPPTGSGTPAGLWLESVVRTGHVGTAVSLPEINFDWTALENRVDTYSGTKPTLNWHRMSTIWTETGGKISIRYSDKECSASNLPGTPHTNTKRCYPVLFEEDDVMKTEYFHKYLVTEVNEADLTGGGTDKVTKYEYPGTPAWRFTDDDGISDDKFRTWSDFRGYDQVLAKVGAPGQETLTEKRFLRGMHASKDTPSGTLKVVSSTSSIGPAVNDENAFAGLERESIVYNGSTTAPVSKSVNVPWQSDPASASRNMGDTTSYSRYTGIQTTFTSVALDGNRGWITTKSHTGFDAYGLEDTKTDFGKVSADGLTDVTGDETCTDNTYNRNTGLNILSLVGRVEMYALACGTAPSTKDQVISDVQTAYDNVGFGVQPTRGLPTRVDVLKDWAAPGGTVWLTSSKQSYDAYGRVYEAWDVRDNKTATTYEPAASAPVTKITTVAPVLGSSYTDMDPARNAPTASVDVNGKRTDLEYDGLGRLTSVWLPNHTKASFPTNPSLQHSYLIRNSGGPNAVTSNKLNAAGNYVSKITLFDGLLRNRQTQEPAVAGGGTVFSETIYDAAGRAAIANNHFYDPAIAPGTSLRTILDWENKSQTVTEYDRADRIVAAVVKSAGAEKWRSSKSYGGDRVYTTPPDGGTPTTAITDIRGRTIELWQHQGSLAGAHDTTKYGYDSRDLLTEIEDPAGNTWTNVYDMQQRLRSTDDPDKGIITITYNDLGEVTETVDGRGTKLAYEYDSIGRKTGLYDNSIAPANKRASWAYDPTGAKGRLASSSRWVSGAEYKVKVRGYTPLYQETGEDYTIPSAETGLAGTYTISRAYKVDGSPATIVFPNAGGLGGETVTYIYDSVTGQPEQLQTNWPGAGQYVTDSAYTAYGELSFQQFQQTAGNWLQRSFTYDDVTRQLKQDTTVRQIAPQMVSDIHLEYDKFGNIQEIRDTPAGGTSDIQCFDVDHLQRLREAWTPSSGNCASLPASVGSLGGPAPYWHSWELDKVGNRTKQTLRKSGSTTESTHTYPAAGADLPHAASSVTATGTGAGTKRYTYDAGGNMTCRPKVTVSTNDCVAAGKPGSQTLTWDSEGKLASLADGAATHSYLYAADGNRFVARDGGGTTIYLAGQEIRRTTAGAISSTRYYRHNGTTVAMRSNGSSVSWLINDHQGTQSISVDSGGQAVTQRRQAPFGISRDSTPPVWPNAKGFVAGDKDPTGLTYMGARAYDAAEGRFISPDPVRTFSEPQQLNAYAYANNSPISTSDPTGLCWVCDAWDSATDWVSDTWNDTTDWVGDAWDNTTDWISSAWEATTEWVSDAWEATTEWVSDAWEATTEWVSDAWKATTEWVSNAWDATVDWVANTAWPAIQKTAQVIWQTARTVTNLPATAIGLGWALFKGGDCSWNWSHFMAVCKGMSGGYGRGGMTIGSVFLTGNDPFDDDTLRHEEKHADQYAIFGGFAVFPLLYWAEEERSGGCGENLFEQWAGLSDGGYKRGKKLPNGKCP